EHRVVASRERRRPLPDKAWQFGVAARQLRIQEAAGVRDAERAERLFVFGLDAPGQRLRALERAPRRQAEDPVPEAGGTRGRSEAVAHVSEHLPRHGRRGVDIARDAPAHIVHGREVAVEELAEGVGVTSGSARCEEFVVHACPRAGYRSARPKIAQPAARRRRMPVNYDKTRVTSRTPSRRLARSVRGAWTPIR